MSPEELAALNRAIATLFDRWCIEPTTGARILDIDPESYASWKRGGLHEVDDDLKLRLTLLLSIHVQVRGLFLDARRGYAWMQKPNADLGAVPVTLLASGDLNAWLRLLNFLTASAQYP